MSRGPAWITAIAMVATGALALAGCNGDEDQTAAGQSTTVPALRSTTTETPTQSNIPTGAASATPVPTPALPRHVAFAPGDGFDTGTGMYYVDPRTGAVEGWQFPDEPSAVGWQVSPGGRYIVQGFYRQGGVPQASWRLYDTLTGRSRDLPARPGPFSPDESRYVLAGAGGIGIARVEDGAIERAFPVGRFDDQPGFLPGAAWSPDGESLLVWFGQPPLGGAPPAGQTGPPMNRIMRLIVGTGEAKDIAETALGVAGWSPDGRQYFVGSIKGGGITTHDAADDRILWRMLPAELQLPVGVRGAEPYGSIELPRVRPDGARAAIAVRGPADAPLYRVYVSDPQGGAVRFWVEGAWTCGPHVWTADGRWLLVHGRRGAMSGSFLVAADGSEMRYLGPHVEDLSPVDANTAAVLLGRSIEGRPPESVLLVIDVPSGATHQAVTMTGIPGWDFAHDPLWLLDGRIVVHAPHLGHGGCGAGPPSQEQLTIRFPN